MMKRIIALAVALSLVFTMSAAAAFADVDASSAQGKAIAKLAEMKVLGGFEDGTFRPDATVTREQFAKILYVLKNGTPDAALGETGFSDVASNRWSAGYIKWAADNKIVGGMGDGTFAPAATLTMAQASKMLVVSAGAPNTLDWPQGFIDEARSKGLYKDVADFKADDPAPRGIIAVMAYNGLGNSDSSQGTAAGVVVSIEGAKIAFANADENGRGNVPSAKIDRANPTDPIKGITTTYSVDQASVKTLDVADSCTVKVVDGKFGSTAAASDGSLADVKASTADTFYSASYSVAGGKVTAITFYKQGAAAVVYEAFTALCAVPLDISAYCKPGETSEISVWYGPQANPKDLPFTITALTQPSKGKIDFSANQAKFWRLRYTVAADAKVGDVTSFTYTLTGTVDKTIVATGTVKLHIVAPTVVPEKTINVAPGTTFTMDKDSLYKDIQYTVGAPNGIPSFLLYDNDKKAVIDSGKEFYTKLGAKVVRTSGDIITYTAPASEGTDEFWLAFSDGWDFSYVKVTVNILND